MLGTHGQWAVRVFSVRNSNVITSVPWNLYFECQIRWLETFILVLTTSAGQDRGSNPDQPHTVRRISVYCTTILKTFRIKTLRAINRYVRMFASLYYHLQLSYYLQLGWYIRETSVRVYELHTYERGQGQTSQGHVVVALATFCTYQAFRQF